MDIVPSEFCEFKGSSTGDQVDEASVTESVRSMDPGSTDHFGGRRQFAVVWLVVTPSLVRPCVALCHSKFQGQGCWVFPRTVGFSGYGIYPFGRIHASIT